MYYPDDIIEEVRRKNDIVDVISGYVKLKKKGDSYFGLCPFHSEKSASFSVSQSKQIYRCFGCQAGGNVFSFIMEYEKFTFPESVKFLAEKAGVELPEMEMSAEARKKASLKQTLMELNKKVAMYYFKMLRSEEHGAIGRRYFEKRELSWDTVKSFGLGYSGQYRDDLYQFLKHEGYQDEILKQSGLFNYGNDGSVYNKFFNRVMFPIFDMHGQVIGFGGRVMGDGEPKYLNSPETEVFDKGRNLFGLNFARNSKKTNLIICEGYMDVIALHQAGFNQAVASLGTALTTGHAALLKRYTSNVLLCYDSDGAGTKAAIRAIPMLKAAGLHVKVINMKPYKDPDEFIKALGAEEFQKRIDEAVTSFNFEVKVLESQYNLEEPESQTEFYRELAKRLSEFTEPLERDTYIKSVVKNYSLDYEYFRNMVNDIGEKMLVVREQEAQKAQVEMIKAHKTIKDTGVRMAQRILLTWIIDVPESFSKVVKYISPQDFSDELYKEVCGLVFEQFEKGNERIQPAAIISRYESEEEHKEVASLFSEEIDPELKEKDRERALTEAIVKVKNHSLERRSETAESIEDLMKLSAEKKELETPIKTIK